MILPAKLVNERLMFVIDYGDKLPWGSVITLAKITVDVSSGTDPSPQRVFSQTWDIEGTKVTYQVRQGLPGVIYNLNTAVQVAGEWLYVTMKLAVMPDSGDVGALYPLTRTFTSLPYVQYVAEDLNQSLVPTGGDVVLLLIEATMQFDDLDQSLIPTDGDLFEVPPPEFIDTTELGLIPTDGDLIIPPPGELQDMHVDLSLIVRDGALTIPPLGELQDCVVELGLLPTDGDLGNTDSLPVVSELLFAGADGSTTFTDTTGKVWTPFGNVQIDTSLGDQRALFDGNGDYLTTPHVADLQLSDDFDIQFILRFASLASYQTILAKTYTTQLADSWVLQTANGNGRLSFYNLPLSSGSTLICQENVSAVINTDYTYRIRRINGLVTIERDGVITAAGFSSATFASAGILSMGGGSSTGFNNYWFNGWMKAFSIKN